jgi:hypothetical protein
LDLVYEKLKEISTKHGKPCIFEFAEDMNVTDDHNDTVDLTHLEGQPEEDITRILNSLHMSPVDLDMSMVPPPPESMSSFELIEENDQTRSQVNIDMTLSANAPPTVSTTSSSEVILKVTSLVCMK